MDIYLTFSTEKEEEEQTSTLKKKVAAEKKQREHLLQLNQILAKQVMEKSKMVAGKYECERLEFHCLEYATHMILCCLFRILDLSYVMH